MGVGRRRSVTLFMQEAVIPDITLPCGEFLGRLSRMIIVFPSPLCLLSSETPDQAKAEQQQHNGEWQAGSHHCRLQCQKSTAH